MKKTIIAIIGESGCGKTSLSTYMSDNCGIPYICSYTTRPIRPNETDGVEHIFVSDSDIPDKSDMIAYTEFGGYKYWATKQQVDDIVTYVIDEKGFVYLRDNFSDDFDFVKVYMRRLNNNVDQKRRDRDADRIVFDDSYYDIVMNNNYENVDDMCKASSEIILKYLKGTR